MTFTLTQEKNEITVEGDRLSPHIYIPINRDLIDDGQECSDLSFKIVPIFFNIGINEKQSMADAMTRNPNDKVSLIGKETQEGQPIVSCQHSKCLFQIMSTN